MSPYLSNVIISELVGNWLLAIGRNSLSSGKLTASTFADTYRNGSVADQWVVGYLHRGDCAVAEREELEVEVENVLGKEVGEL
jgi:hypothetical protein